MRIRKFNESASKEISEDYIKDLFQSFTDDSWDVEINKCFYIDTAIYYEIDLNNDKVLNSNQIGEGICIEAKRLGDTYNILTSIEEYDSLVYYIPDFRSKLQTLLDDGYSFRQINMKTFESIELLIESPKILLDNNAIQNLKKLVENGLPKVCDIIGKNKIELQYPTGNNTQFAKLWKYRISKEHKTSSISPEFERWFDKTFKITHEVVNDDDDEDYNQYILNIL